MRERELRNRTSRRITWTGKEWKTSRNGNYYLKIEERHLLICKDKNTGRYKVKIGGTFGRKSFDNFREAKMAAFTGMEYLKERGEW